MVEIKSTDKHGSGIGQSVDSEHQISSQNVAHVPVDDGKAHDVKDPSFNRGKPDEIAKSASVLALPKSKSTELPKTPRPDITATIESESRELVSLTEAQNLQTTEAAIQDSHRSRTLVDYHRLKLNDIYGDVGDEKTYSLAEHVTKVALSFNAHGFHTVLGRISTRDHLQTAEELNTQAQQFNKHATERDTAAVGLLHALATPRTKREAERAAKLANSSVAPEDAMVKGAFPTSFEPGRRGNAQWMRSDKIDLGAKRYFYVQWRDHEGVLRTVVPHRGTVAARDVSQAKKLTRSKLRNFFSSAITAKRTVKAQVFSIKVRDENGKKSRILDLKYNEHFAPVRAATHDAMIHYHKKEYDAFLNAVVNHPEVTRDLLDTFKDGPMFSEQHIKTLLQGVASLSPIDYGKCKCAALAAAHYIRNISVHQNKTLGHPQHGLWTNARIVTNPAYITIDASDGVYSNLQKLIDAVLREAPHESAMRNLTSAAVRAAVIFSAMAYCAQLTDYENRVHLENVAAGVGAAVSIIGGALNAAPFVAVGDVFAGLADPLEKAIVGHEESKFQSGALLQLVVGKVNALKSDAKLGTRIPGLAPADGSPARAALGEEFNKIFDAVVRAVNITSFD